MRDNEKQNTLDRNLCEWRYKYLHDSLFDTAKLQTEKVSSNFYARILFKLECFVDELLSNDEIPFVLSISKQGTTEYNPSYQFYKLTDFIDVVNMLMPYYYYSERINIFITCCNSTGLLNIRDRSKKTYPNKDKTPDVEMFNNLVNKIRHEWKIKKIQAKVNAKRKEATHRHIEYCNYVDALFKSCNRQVIFRIDLYYQKQYTDNITISDITNDLNHLFENKRCNSLFKPMNGYIAKIEYDLKKRLHTPVIFFFDDSEINNYTHLAEEIGEYWIKTITKGRGDYWSDPITKDRVDLWNFNNRAEFYEYGINVINNIDLESIKKLKFAIGYLCKADQFVRPKFETKVRLLRRGNSPKKPVKKRGRPRKDQKDMT